MVILVARKNSAADWQIPWSAVSKSSAGGQAIIRARYTTTENDP
jgi:hypothetical protein